MNEPDGLTQNDAGTAVAQANDPAPINRRLDTRGCPDCKGSGQRRRFVLYVGVLPGVCPTCQGWGTLPTATEMPAD